MERALIHDGCMNNLIFVSMSLDRINRTMHSLDGCEWYDVCDLLCTTKMNTL